MLKRKLIRSNDNTKHEQMSQGDNNIDVATKNVDKNALYWPSEDIDSVVPCIVCQNACTFTRKRTWKSKEGGC